MSAQNIATARRWMDEVWNQGRTETIWELVTPESVCHSESGDMRGAEGFIAQGYTPLRTVFSDVHVNVEDAVGDGDRVVLRWTTTARHTGNMPGMPATGRRVTFRGMTWIRFENGKMMEGWDCWNQTGLFQALQTGNAPPSVGLV